MPLLLPLLDETDRTPDQLARDAEEALALKEAMRIIDRFWTPSGPDKDDCLRRLGLQIQLLRRGVQDRMCRKCGVRFPFFRKEQFHLASKGRHEFEFCPTCRTRHRVVK
jgi:hypothetical protein